MLFALRNLLGTLLTPSTLVAGALVFGAVLLFFERTRRRGRSLVTTGVAALLLLAWGVPFDAIGRWLETRHPAVLATAEMPELARVRWIAVLGGGHQAELFLPPSAHPHEAFLYRVVEGVRLHQGLPENRLLFSGYGRHDPLSSARVGARLARALGVGEDRIVLEEAPRTTADEAERIRAHIGNEPFLLVTSAVHMPRAVRIFERAGLTPIPAPTGHQAFERRRTLRDWIIPPPQRIVYADAVMHELLGLLAVRMGLP